MDGRDMDIEDILNDFEHGSKDSTKVRKTNSKDDLYGRLVQAMLNERMAPEILPFEHDLMQTVLESLTNQHQYLVDSYEYGDRNSETGLITSDFKLQLMIVETDIERYNYIIRLYLRTRLSKIDKFSLFYINRKEEKEDDLLSKEEKEYMYSHFKILTELYNNCFLKKLPHFLTFLDDTSGGQSMITEPDFDEPVFIKSVSKQHIYIGSDDEDLRLEKDGIYVVRYRLVKEYISIGDVILI